ncbi:hypothetical protein EMIHUDRAFT_215522 [Emiliania huxleyi CCMP1516]|uniref:Actin-fragmin kinase catalytic domain-containing protein n=2 Tax=Emiliania huxleyi TaxID=2903 RepID=A0A0D3IHI3_EMIH1|nr:hypothetical protein EMIHUDRAFT_215522 [Emiliania huxleyi CCMP1516]EOD10718.1 hypothetical protein EMIHUDRAFT_215522 [Emiliania huxleyi CCMP1516]|eukprot:XP_005763147.1 hypothetical protein EMIHUDRAFT_215522 [Emiliania huxleyi CCMP1516]
MRKPSPATIEQAREHTTSASITSWTSIKEKVLDLNDPTAFPAFGKSGGVGEVGGNERARVNCDGKNKWAVVEAPTGGQSTAFVYEDWADLGRSDIAAPLPWALASRCVHIAGGIGSNGGVLAVQLGEGDAASAVCVKQFDAKKVRPDMEMLAAHLLRAARVRAPLARYATQAEIDDEIAPAVGKAYFEGGGSWACPRLCMQAMFEQPAIVAKLGLPDKLVDEWRDKWQAERAQKRVAIEAGEERAEAIAVIEFVRGPTLLQGGGGALGEAEYEALGRLAAFDVLLNNFDRLPVLFDNEGNLANVMLERREGGGVTCCAIDSCVNPLRGAAREKYLRRLRSEAPEPDLAQAAAALAAAAGGAALAGADRDELDAAAGFVTEAAAAIAGVVAGAGSAAAGEEGRRHV